MKDLLIKVKAKGLPIVTNGRADNAEEFFNKVIKSQFSEKKAIQSIHKTLMEYIEHPNAIFALRLYGSDPNNNYNNLRRGFLTQYPGGKKTVFCDNTFAMPFAALKRAGEAFTFQELEQYMNDSSTRFGFGSTSEERELAYYNWNGNKASINLNIHGWYLAHIVPVGKSFLGKNLREYFNNPEREEWACQKDHIRRPKEDMTDIELSVLKAHFLRMVHPLNSFMVPKKGLLAYNGKNIGEEMELINIVQEYIMNEFPEEYAEFAEKAQIPQFEITADSTIGNIIWNSSESVINREKSKLITIKKVQTVSRKELSVVTDTDDIYDFDAEEHLEKSLRSIGKGTFVKLYPLLKENDSISIDNICKSFPEFQSYKPDSQRTRLSGARSIFKQHLEKEALSNILNSSKLSNEIRKEAEELFSAL